MAAELTPAPEKRRRGRPVDTALGQRILSVTLQQLSALGYTKLEIESVAAAAACSKTTIYRRWGSKGQLVAAAIASGYQDGPAIDTGTLLDDLVEHTSGGHSLLALGNLPAVAWAATFEPEVASVLRESVLKAQDAAADALIARAIARGELPADADGRAILHAALGLGLYRRYISEDEGLPEQTLRQVLAALIDAPPRVLPAGS
ncbi:TetR/AcrR family transcriptional regulator [Microterricola pindariensis]|uniref:HTH tetR-type domain-containing protein n=1 Tax=Microterricola pindariensis TaxID=478010 RepID=A0ABX5AT41_9MICO|nr:TetR/AcrR family transcriptional regulator [Microterricola pindariensis]PPL16136.1 hypothetical protein GY24_13185 [Microterricola pindariensis]